MKQRARGILYSATGVGAVAIVLLLSWVLFKVYDIADDVQGTTDAIRETQQKGSPVLLTLQDAVDGIGAVQDQLADCLTPGGECYERSKKNQANAIGSINEITYYAVSCADEPGTQTLEEIQGCVIQRLGRSHR